MAIDKVGHVVTQLNSLAGRLDPKEKGDGIFIRCPYHAGGNENTGSCCVYTKSTNREVGGFFCFACKESGSWNKLASTLKLQGFKASDRINDVYAFSFVDAAHSEKTNLPDFTTLKKWKRGKEWRTISSKVVRRFGGCKPDRYLYEDDFIYFPVVINKHYVGGIYARKVVTKKGKKNGELSYVNTAGKWTKTSLFGYNLAKKRKGPLWIVEGPRDTMKVYMLGGRVVGLMGAYVSKQKVALIQALDPPCVIVATDPDDAGQQARDKLKKALVGIPVLEAEFPSGKDPGSFTEKSFERMMKRLGITRKRYLGVS